MVYVISFTQGPHKFKPNLRREKCRHHQKLIYPDSQNQVRLQLKIKKNNHDGVMYGIPQPLISNIITKVNNTDG